MQYNPKGFPIVQCQQCNGLGHFVRDCQLEQEKFQLLCKWCGPRDHEELDV